MRVLAVFVSALFVAACATTSSHPPAVRFEEALTDPNGAILVMSFPQSRANTHFRRFVAEVDLDTLTFVPGERSRTRGWSFTRSDWPRRIVDEHYVATYMPAGDYVIVSETTSLMSNPDYRGISRPFSSTVNCFTEGAQLIRVEAGMINILETGSTDIFDQLSRLDSATQTSPSNILEQIDERLGTSWPRRNVTREALVRFEGSRNFWTEQIACPSSNSFEIQQSD